MKIKCKPRALRRWLASLLCAGLLCQTMVLPAFADAGMEETLAKGTAQTAEELETENGWSLADLKTQFPEGRYWNHMDKPGSGNNDPMHTSSQPCTSHGARGYNSSTCNHPNFGYYYCCWGYADQLGYLYSGSNPEKWTKLEGTSATNYIDNLKTGDIVRFRFNSGAEHSIFVTSVTNNRVYYTDCNVSGKCEISWSHSQTKAYFKENSRTLWVQVCPGGNPPPPDPNVDSLGCSTAYAGWYQETGRDGANVNSIHTKNWNSAGPVGALSKGEYVYVSKATGTGSGNLGHIMYNGVERYIAMGLFTRVNDRTGDPVAALDTCVGKEGGISLTGWAYDWDSPYESLQIEVYLQNALVYRGVANVERSDVNKNVSGDIGNYHGFNLWIPADAGNYSYSVYAVNVGAGNDKIIDFGFLTVPAVDTTGPEISKRTIYNVTSEGFDVSVVSTDNVGVDRVVVKAWTNDNDVVEGNATRNGDTYTYHVSISDHGNARGTYYVNIWAYDAAGNYRYFNSPREVVVPEPDPILTFNANGGTAEFTTKQAERGAAYGALPEAWMDGYVFDGWYTNAVGGDRVSSSTLYTAAGQTTLYAHWIPVAADAAQGWALQDGTLIITVQGAMQDYTSARETPWFSNRADIRKIVVQNGVTSIGDYAFYGCENVTSVTLPGTVTQIGKLAFYGCKGLTSLELPESVAVVKDYAFAKASGLKTITFHGSAPLFGAGIFADVNADARCPAGDSSWTDTVRQSYTGSIRWSGVSEAELAAQTSELQLDDPVLESLLADSCV